MSQAPSNGPNAEQFEFWSEQAGPRWVSLQPALDRRLGDWDDRLLDRAAIADGERVIDVGCGCGSTSLALSPRVGPDGSVTGLDLSPVMLARARERAERARCDNLQFRHADVQVHPFEPRAADAAVSRFGVMFFAAPGDAFANLASALRPGGRLVFTCWRQRDENPWMTVPCGALSDVVELPPPTDPEAPGPFALGDGDRLGRLLREAGFTNVKIDPLDLPMDLGVGEGLRAAVDFVLQLGPAAAALSEATDEVCAAADAAVTTALAPHADGGDVVLPSASWLVEAVVD